MFARSKDTKSVVASHLQAFFQKSVDGILQDYAEDSVLIAPGGALHGLAEIRQFFEAFIGNLPAGFVESFELQRQHFEQDVGYIAWHASPWVRLGTDTFVVRRGKILRQTFAAYPPLP